MEDEHHVMVSPAEIAERDGISKQAVTKMVRQLVDHHDLPVERDGRGRIVRFSLAHYDHHRGQFASSAKVNAARPSGAERSSSPASISPADSRDEALRQEAWLKVGRERLRHQEAVKQLRRADLTDQAIAHCGREIQALVSRLQNQADELALAVSKEGVHGLRVALRQAAFEINSEIADRLSEISAAAPEFDAMIEEEEA